MQSKLQKSIFYKFTFGHFKGVSLLDVYKGCSPLPDVLIKFYVEHYLANVPSENLLHNYAVYTDGKMISMIPKNVNHSSYLEDMNLAFLLISEPLECHFKNLFTTTYKTFSSDVFDLNELYFIDWKTKEKVFYKVSENFSYFVCDGSPKYIEWCIINLGIIFLLPETLVALENIEVNKFIGVRLERKSANIFEIIQEVQKCKFTFNVNAHALNSLKYNNSQASKREVDDFYEREKYTQDDAFDDAFGGEDSAYWNID